MSIDCHWEIYNDQLQKNQQILKQQNKYRSPDWWLSPLSRGQSPITTIAWPIRTTSINYFSYHSFENKLIANQSNWGICVHIYALIPIAYIYACCWMGWRWDWESEISMTGGGGLERENKKGKRNTKIKRTQLNGLLFQLTRLDSSGYRTIRLCSLFAIFQQ